MSLSPAQEVFLDHMGRASDEEVARFLHKNARPLEKFFINYFPNLDFKLLTKTLKGDNEALKLEAYDFMGQCFDCHKDRIPYDKIKFPVHLQRKIARKDADQNLWDKVCEAGRNLRDFKFLKFTFKDIAETYALTASKFSLTKGERQALLALGTIPVKGSILLPMFTGASINLATMDEAQASLTLHNAPAQNKTYIPPDMMNTGSTQKPPLPEGSVLAYGAPSQGINARGITDAFMNSLPSVAPQLDSPSIQDSPNAAYEPLLALIEMGESTIGGYNAVYLPYAKANQNINFDLTKMSVNEVRALQDKMVAEGFDSTALGRYQIIRDTMDYLIKKMNLTGNELYDARIQDDMAITLLRRRGVDSYLSGKLPLNKFITRMSKEWASFPEGPNNQSYYKGVGNNVAHLTYKQIKSGLLESMALAEKQGLQTTRFGGKMASITIIPIPTARPHTPSGS